MITTPLPFQEAIGFLLNKEDLPADWDAAMWQAQESDFRTKAFFSANVENARFLDRAHGLLFDYMAKVRETIVQPDGTVVTALKVAGREHFVKRMRDFMIAEGMAKHHEFKGVDQKDITDIRSLARLRLIFDTNVRQAYGFGQWKQGMTPGALKSFPAARLIRDRSVKEPRPRHQNNLGEVLLKTDPRWAEFHNAREIGGFGVPWGPYGFNSGVTQEDVSKAEARQLGLKVDSEPPPPAKITDGTEASVKKMDPDIKAKLRDELRRGIAEIDAKPTMKEAAREAASKVRREMLSRGLAAAEQRGDTGKATKYRKAIAELPTQSMAVRDDGGFIRLGSAHGGPFNQTDKESAKAERIRMAVDRLAETPKKNPQPRKLTNRSRHLLAKQLTGTPDELKIFKSPYEIGVEYDEGGILKKVTLGDSKSIEVPIIPESGRTYSHNHPQGKGPSSDDIKWILGNHESTLRIIAMGPGGKPQIIQIRAITPIPEAVASAIAKIYKAACNENGDNRKARIDAMALISKIFGNMLQIQTRNL